MKFQTLVKPALMGAVLAAVLNVIVYFIWRGINVINESNQPQSGKPLDLSTVIINNSVLPVLGAAIVLFLLYKFFKKADLIFKIIGGVALLASVTKIIAQPDTTADLKVLSILMFIVPAIAVGYFLLGATSKTQ